MFLDPNQLSKHSSAEILEAASEGHLGLDGRMMRALIEKRDETIPALLEHAKRDRSHDVVDLAPELIALFRYWKLPEGLPFLMEYIKEDPENVTEDAIEAIHELGPAALEPLLQLYGDLEEDESGEVAFLLASLRVKDPRILQILTARLPFDLNDSAFLLGVYGDPAAIPALQAVAAELGKDEREVKEELAETIESLRKPPVPLDDKSEPFDVYAGYPETADLPIDLLDDDERSELLTFPVASIRAAAANSFFNREVTPEQRSALLKAATSDEDPTVRARAWESLTLATEDSAVIAAMLERLRSSDSTVVERGGLLVGLSSEADRNEVREAIVVLYNQPEGRAKALEAMWRSMHPSFRDYFPKHLTDPEEEVKRSAIWGVGYYGIKSEMDKLRKFFDDEELRSDAIFAYALCVPGEITPGRMKSLLNRVEKDARGLSEMEQELVKAALDERLMLAGKEPYFAKSED